ncbi:MAG: hypothetical protein KME07_19525 [Pegethrix bostrychoides GSE-TBD4-15B]|jgi:predicted Rossmann fold nucleotide-binding protein DprA/Smf involved in DNA uptake|uniref:Uncharacterized protein n=1 Tax=Pegethrix bostrychoides GSE-TBD4-15B TaxID=2839662 RepID=A0A951U677_9CYAN|nr:hypothetical protein [Pegethrix bostrychoides GSE-TBD4-15B]
MASRAKQFNGFSYRALQQSNSKQRRLLSKTEQQWLKANGYKNLGWSNVIQLHQKISEFQNQTPPDDPTLEELFLQADRVGNKYLGDSEIAEFNQKLAQEVSEVSELIDQQFPDTEVEIIDFSHSQPKTQKKRR